MYETETLHEEEEGVKNCTDTMTDPEKSAIDTKQNAM